MPNIPVYNAPTTEPGFRANPAGEEAEERVGYTAQRLGMQTRGIIEQTARDVGQTAGHIYEQYQNHATLQQTSAAMQWSAQRQAQFEDEKQKALASPDPDAAMRDAISQLNADYTNYGDENITTLEGKEQWARMHAAAYSQALIHGMAEAHTEVGNQTIQKFEASQNNLASVVTKNPAALDDVLGQMDLNYAGIKSGLTADQQTHLDNDRQAMRESLTLAAVNSAAKTFFINNPDATPDQFPLAQLSSDAKGAMILNAEGQLKASAVVHTAWEQQKMAFLTQSEQAAGTAVQNSFVGGVYDPAAGLQMMGALNTAVREGKMAPQVAASTMRALQSLHNETVDQAYRSVEFNRAGVRFNEEQQKYHQDLPAPTSVPAVAADMSKKIAAGQMPPAEVRELYNNKQISTEDYIRAYGDASVTYQKPGSVSLYTSRAYTGTVKTMNSIIAGNTIMPNAAVSAAQGNAARDLAVAMGRASQSGVDPQSLLDPSSPNYWPTPERMKQYVSSQAEINTQILQAAKPVPANRKPLNEILMEHFKNMGPPAGAPSNAPVNANTPFGG